MNTENTSMSGYHETKKHTEFMFPYNVYPCTIPDDFPSVFLHWQDTMEIIYIKKGCGIGQVDLSSFEVHTGDIILVPPGHLHGLNHIHGQRMEYENIIFDLEFLGINTIDICSQKYLLPLKNNQLTFPPRITLQDEHYREIASCLDHADELCSSRHRGFELGVKAEIMKLFSLIFQFHDTKQSQAELPQMIDRLKSAICYIEENYQHPVRIEDAALHCGYSAPHFMRWFKQMTGTSFIQYLNRFRLEKACLDLKNTDKTILEIAEQVGFDNLSNFNRLFKKQFHATPKQFRQQKSEE